MEGAGSPLASCPFLPLIKFSQAVHFAKPSLPLQACGFLWVSVGLGSCLIQQWGLRAAGREEVV